MGVGAHKHRARTRNESPQLAALLQCISSELIRCPHHNLGNTIDTALGGLGEALAADQALVTTRAPSGDIEHHVWERTGMNGRARHGPVNGWDSSLAKLELQHTLVCTNRKQLPASALPGQMSAAILVPLHDGAKPGGLLALTARTPRVWAPQAVEAAERLAEMLAAGLHRMASQSSVALEQEKRLHAEAETRRLRDQLAHAGRVSMLGELAASLAHELNQPLTAIYTNAQAAHRFLDRKRPALGEARGALHDLGQDCRRASEVLGRLRQMFRRHETERVPVEVGPLIEHMLKLLHEDAVARGVDVVVEIRRDLPAVNGDRIQLEQVLMNLLVNAFDAVTGQPGPRQVTVRALARNGAVEVAVLDNGKGIARGDLDRIFEPFFTRKPNGMGMGLAICRSIVEAHGGRIAARDRTERGADFEISLPAAAATGSI
jgi:C4-dicarboxylate-specific signal transduction histidine kinase